MQAKSTKKERTQISSFLSAPYYEVHPGRAVTKVVLYGAIGVSEMDCEHILIKCHGLKLQVSGKRMLLNILEHNTLEIIGRVEGINILNA